MQDKKFIASLKLESLKLLMTHTSADLRNVDNVKTTKKRADKRERLTHSCLLFELLHGDW